MIRARRLTKLYITLCLVIAVAACARAPISPANYTQISTELRASTPEERKALQRKIERARNEKRKLVIVDQFKHKNSASAFAGDASKVGMQSVKKILRSAGVETKEQDIPPQMRQQIEELELSGMLEDNSLLADADYFLLGEILTISVAKEYVKTSIAAEATGLAIQKEFEDSGGALGSLLGAVAAQSAKQAITPPHCAVTARAEVSLLLYNANPVELLKSMSFEEEHEADRNNVSTCKGIDGKAEALEAVRKTIARSGGDITNIFTPEAYIIEQRQQENDYIFKTSFSSKVQLEPGTTIRVYKRIVSTDPISGIRQEEKALLGTGAIIKTLGTQDIWIALDDDKIRNKVRLGDIVQAVNKNKCPITDTSCWRR